MADSEATLRRTHPATVAVRTLKSLWQMLVGLIVVFVFGSMGQNPLPAFAFAGIVVLSVVVSAAFAWLSWWRFRYGIVGSDLLVVEGLLVRKRRSIPIARVHGVNVRADLFMRVLGLVEIAVQTAGGGSNEPEATIGAIPLAHAEELRSALLFDQAEVTRSPLQSDRAEVTPGPDASGADVADADASGADVPGSDVPHADPIGRMSDFRGAFGGSEHRGGRASFEHKVPLGRLVAGEVTSNRVPIIMLVVFGAAAQLVEVVGLEIVERTAVRAATLAVPVLAMMVLLAGMLVAVFAVAATVARDLGFTARRYESRIETEAGLFERRQISLPVTRIQAVRIEESWLRRLLGLATIHVDTAGLERAVQQGQQAMGSKAMVPVARRDDVPALMHGLLPEAEEFPEPHPLPTRALRFYLFVPTLTAATVAAATSIPLALIVYRPALMWAVAATGIVAAMTASVRALQWRAAGAGTGDDAITLRSGVLGRKRVRLTRSRIQSLAVRQNPFQRRARLASVQAVSVSGSAAARYGVSHVDEADASRLVAWYRSGLARPRGQDPG